MSFYIIENEDGNTMDYNGYFNCPIRQTELFDEPNEPAKLAKELGGHVVKLTEEQKVKLPREVGKWVDACHKDDNAQSLLNYNETPYSVDDWADDYENDGINNHFCKLLMQAYLYGWEAEPEAKWYVKVPDSWNGPACEYPWAVKYSDGDGEGVVRGSERENDPRYQFTRAELKKYHLDSGIFTLVPVDNEK